MRQTRALSWFSGLPALVGVALLAVPVSLLANACGGTTEDDLNTAAGAGGVAGQGGSAGSAGSAGQSGAAGSSAGSAGASGAGAGAAGSAGAAGASASGSGGSQSGSGGTEAGGSAGSATSPCATCINKECSDQVKACNDDPDCADTGQCVLENCLGSTSLTQVAVCAVQQCNADIQNPNKNLLPIAQCAQQSCGSDCAFGSGGKGGASGSGGKGGSGGSSGSGGSGGQAGDPGAAPGKINCGDKTCDQASQGDCCISVSFSGPSYSCSTPDKCGGGFSVSQPCDGPEDCKTGQVCCGKFSQQGGNVTCADTCEGGGQQGGSFKLCHKDDDCSQPDTCQTCPFGGFGISFTFRVCGTKCPGNGGGPGGGGLQAAAAQAADPASGRSEGGEGGSGQGRGAGPPRPPLGRSCAAAGRGGSRTTLPLRFSRHGLPRVYDSAKVVRRSEGG